jgi:dTDP-4-dehydrorhamnose 3,5-epimerase
MIITPTEIQGVLHVKLQPIGDARGAFMRVMERARIREFHPAFEVINVNRSRTRAKGTIRGLHYQRAPRSEDKLVQCLHGKIFDVAVDLRPESPTFRRWTGVTLSAENQEMFFIPKGCAHGFQTLVDDCLVEYFVSEVYSPEHEGGVRWDDPAIGVAWPLPDPFTSEKDAGWAPLVR